MLPKRFCNCQTNISLLTAFMNKIFSHNTIKVSYCCTQNLGNIIKLYNKKPINSNNQIILPCNCRRKEDCPFQGKCRANDVVYKLLLQQLVFPIKFIQELHKESFKNSLTNHDTYFKNESKIDNTTLAKYIQDLKLEHNVMPTLKWHIFKSVIPYLNITKKCRLCLQEKFEILSYPSQMSQLIKDLNLFQSAAT